MNIIKILQTVTLGLGITVLGSMTYSNYKWEQFKPILAAYDKALHEKRMDVMCTAEAAALGKWFEENYSPRSPNWLLLKALWPSSVDYLLNSTQTFAGRHHPRFYHQQLQGFYRYLDENTPVRRTLEQQIYASTDEMSIDVHSDQESFQIIPKKDPSDHLYATLLQQIREDAEVQYYLAQIKEGDRYSVDEFWARLKEVARQFPTPTDSERSVVASFPEEIEESALLEIQELAVENIALAKEIIELGETKLKIIKDNSDILTSSLNMIKQIIAYQEKSSEPERQWHQNKREYERKLQQNQQETVQVQKEIDKLYQNLQRYQQEADKEVWPWLREDFIQFQVRREIRGAEALNPTIIAFGHTHPYTKATLDAPEPSSPDLRNSYRKPELVFAALSDRWRIYEAVCGESRQVREYRRTP